MMGPQGYPLVGHHAHSSISIHVTLMSGKAVQVPHSMKDPLRLLAQHALQFGTRVQILRGDS